MAATADSISRDRAAALAEALRATIAGEVRFEDGDRALYATDGSNYRQVPIGVVLPKNRADIVATVELCRDFGAPVLARGAGTSLAGQCCNTAVILDCSKYMHDIVDIDSAGHTATVQPGCILDHLRQNAERYHLTFGPDPATHDHNTLGGMLGNNSCGIHSVMAGRTADNVEALEILTYDGERMWVGETSAEELQRIIEAGGRRGEIYRRMRDLRDKYAGLIRERYPDIPRRVSGYNLDELLPERGFNVARALVGSEGTLVTILQARLQLVHSPPVRHLVVLGFDDVYAAGDAVPAILEHQPVGLEGVDDKLIDYMRLKDLHTKNLQLLPGGKGWLLVELGEEDADTAAEAARRLIEAARQLDGFVGAAEFADKQDQEQIWKIRESGLAATAHVPGQPDAWPGWEDSAVPPHKVGAYLRDFRAKLDEYGYDCSLYGHFGDGCIHVRIDFGVRDDAGIEKYRRFVGEMADLVVQYGGSFSGEHGDGQARAELLPKMYGEELMQAMREFKSIWDPHWKMNPGKVIDPFPITANLRLHHFHPPQQDTWFAYPEDNGDFNHAAIRCVGIGACRHHSGGVMCPSYMATWEEKHSTRGRARLLFEMIKDGPIKEGWKSEAVKESLDLCLACKGCKKDCPVSVDMATYKAEFNAHYYENRPRPREAYSMGLIYWWSRVAGVMPQVANFFTQTPGLANAIKWAGGIHQERHLPAYAAQSFKDWWREHVPRNLDGPKVILWPDTFNNYFYPEVAAAAVEVLEAAGFYVEIPQASLCCGRPLYAWGMLDTARDLLYQILDHLEPEIRRGTPLIGLEPSCTAVFRDELPNMLPDDERAKRLHAQTYLLTEFLAQAREFQVPRFHQKMQALVHIHCNHHAVLQTEPEQQLLDRLGVDYQVLDSGCCGMAGSFGFEKDHYEVSMAAGERVLLPAVRAADPHTMLITNGFSCREQVRLGANRPVMHMSEVLHMALTEQLREQRGEQPRQGEPEEPPPRPYAGEPSPPAPGSQTRH